MQTLKDIKCDSSAVVVRLHGEGATKRRIMDMGITKGTSVYVRKVAPLGDPVEVTVRGDELSLRKADAQMIEVQESAGKIGRMGNKIIYFGHGRPVSNRQWIK